MESGINIYSFFQISEIIIPDIWKKTILDIPKQVRILDIQKVIFDNKNNNFGYPTIQISKIVITDIRNSYLGFFWISLIQKTDTLISDI